MHTEEQAKEMWCPMVDCGHCCASQCMAWRWTPGLDDRGEATGWPMRVSTGEQWECAACKGEGAVGGNAPDDPREPCGECEGEGRGFKHAPIGYCGLAGMPQVRA